MSQILNIISLWALPALLIIILTVGIVKKVPIYEEFTDGAKDGFKVAINIIPYLVAIVVGISMLRASGAIEMCANFLAPILTKTDGAKDGFKVAINIIPYLVAIVVGISMLRASGAIEMCANFLAPILTKLHVPADTLPLMIVRSLSGSAALGVFSDIANNLGPDSYATKLAAVMVGSSETTFYVLAVYFGAVGISKIRYALIVGLLADIVGIIAAILVCHILFA